MTIDPGTTPKGPGEIVPLWFLKKIMTPLYVRLNRYSGGRLLNTLQGSDVCYVTMKGAKSGKMRTVPLMYVPYEDGILLVASQGGAHTNPAWYYNLIKNGDVEVNYRGHQMKLHARLAAAGEKPDLWPICDQHYPPYAVYRERTTREIPIFVCEPRPSLLGSPEYKSN
jgi:deazaflavin-dependent oxidoreductase (nitroreductase family)